MIKAFVCQECGQAFHRPPSAVWAALFCSVPCMVKHKWARNEAAIARLSTKNSDGCWIWNGPPDKRGGYGHYGSGKRHRTAHRLSWEVHFGPIPQGMHVLHRCDVPLCVNPDHLFLGTHIDNMADGVAKRRFAHGATHTSAKLTEAQVLEIRSASGRTHEALAVAYGVSQSVISAIKAKKTWRYL